MATQQHALHAPIQYGCDVATAIRLMGAELATGAAMTPRELARVDVAWRAGVTPQRLAIEILADRGRTMYVSESLPGRESPFYAHGRYFANAEDARRERTEASR